MSFFQKLIRKWLSKKEDKPIQTPPAVTAEEPTAEEPTAEEPTAKEPTAEESTTRQTDSEKQSEKQSEKRTEKRTEEVPAQLKKFVPLVQKMISELRAKAVKKVPEVGEFRNVFSEFHNPYPDLEVTDFILKVTKPPKSVTGHERRRYLEFVAYNVPSPYICEKVIEAGEKHDILAALDDANLPARLINLIPEMERDLRCN